MLARISQRPEPPDGITDQLAAMEHQNRWTRKDLELERNKVDRLTTAVKTIWNVVERISPGGCASFHPFGLFHTFRFPIRANANFFIHPFLCGELSFDRGRLSVFSACLRGAGFGTRPPNNPRDYLCKLFDNSKSGVSNSLDPRARSISWRFARLALSFGKCTFVATFYTASQLVPGLTGSIRPFPFATSILQNPW